MNLPPVQIRVVLVILVLVAAGLDLRSRRIPNWLCLSGILLGMGLNSYTSEWPGLWLSLEGLGLALLIYVPLFVLRAMGAGDGKLMAAVGACVGPMNWFGVFVLTAVFGAMLGLAAAARRGRLRRTFQNLYLLLMSLRLRQAPYESNPELDVSNQDAVRLPHAVSIALGSLAFLLAASKPEFLSLR